MPKSSKIKFINFSQEFPDFLPGSKHDTCEFEQYRQAIGFESITLKDASNTRTTIKNIVDVSHKINPDHLTPILHGRAELEALYEVALGLHDAEQTAPDGHIIQCGTYRGGVAAVLATAVKKQGGDTPIITLDSFVYARNDATANETTDDVFVAHKRLIENLGLERYVASIWHDDISFLSNFWSSPIRLAVIDTNHTYNQTWREINVISPHIVSGGWMAFHDYKPGDVPKAIHEWLRQTSRCYKLFEAPVYAFIQLL